MLFTVCQPAVIHVKYLKKHWLILNPSKSLSPVGKLPISKLLASYGCFPEIK